MTNRQFYTMKFKSSRLKEFDYDINLSFEEAKSFGEIIALADNQFLRSIRDIKSKKVDIKKLEELYDERNALRKSNSQSNLKKIKQIQSKIYDMMFIPEYITIEIEHTSHYDYLFQNGLLLNGKKYVRLSSSAGQARASTVVFCEEKMKIKLCEVLNNGRNPDVKLAPSKFNAYFGLAGSATKIVSTPRFCVVPDYHSETNMFYNYATETALDKDDTIEVKELAQLFNRFDGQGLISYEMAAKWAGDLGLDYVPAQWCIRQNYIKGMLCTFDIHKFCESENNGNYIVKSLYKDVSGNDIFIDVKNIDVILSESQFKLWDSFPSLEYYQNNCEKNNLKWGVSLYTPKETKDILRMNYQFLQTLNLSKQDIEDICEKFVNWVSGISSDNIYYTLLFLLGMNPTESKINKFLVGSDKYWIKSLILNHSLINDDFIKKKIHEMIKTKIKNACLGEIIVDGNFQTLVSDPYAMMQHVCGLEVTGLLKKNEYYSNYWNEKRVKTVDSMRAPLTYRSEHLKLKLVDNNNLNDWYKHCYTGVIVNVFGKETVNWAGSDWDYDQIATTSNETILNSVYEDELPITYDPPKPTKINFIDFDLYQSDKFSFGSQIGSITNKSTSAYALLPMFDVGSAEYELTMNRLKMCTKLQSAQIDKAKIGRNVKGIPKNWTTYQKIDNEDSPELKEEKELLNRSLLDKHPYFFIYLYRDTKKKYKKYVEGKNLECQHKLDLTLKDLINKPRKNTDERNFLKEYYKQSPVIESDCVMNNVCKYIESIDFSIKEKIHTYDLEVKNHLKSDKVHWNELTFKKVARNIKRYNRKVSDSGNLNMHSVGMNNKYDSYTDNQRSIQLDYLKDIMDDICTNHEELVNYLIELAYSDKPKMKKNLLWELYGNILFNNVKRKSKNIVYFPFPSAHGNIEYLNKKYELREVNLD
ncbi:hypothetical protein G7L40_19895 [Paenibacillus polymyxa]|uniref:Uncharacterized protein n=1 Tax=Paenibacillus polymyxa TaxID=1406 RepID=A0A378Y1V2_PAEPO|nr:hypothetical protein [Paenibacillus polymyxa]MBE7896247.1 hypothetical protein [Paenibacillus polymyxa]MBG9766035.1 hypothetical protein [Paenibacillus polymyxa]MCC3256775.1 hypothetical protein [Paenibacillus polymyxa]QPK54737.1 hypothetical protein G7035_19940 [Paenibacillus polymyxa]QPK59828.1 hypothetical protein G7L40_19895 [Paenibacillus polymyxa]